MANISTAMTLLYKEGVSQVFAAYRVVNATSSDTVVVSSMFSNVSAAMGMNPLSTVAAALTLSGTTLNLAPLTLGTGALILFHVVGNGV